MQQRAAANDFCLYNFPKSYFDQDEEDAGGAVVSNGGGPRVQQTVKSSSSYYYQNARDIIKLDYKMPISMEYVNGEAKCIVPKRFNALQIDSLGLAPWHSDYKIRQSN